MGGGNTKNNVISTWRAAGNHSQMFHLCSDKHTHIQNGAKRERKGIYGGGKTPEEHLSRIYPRNAG